MDTVVAGGSYLLLAFVVKEFGGKKYLTMHVEDSCY